LTLRAGQSIGEEDGLLLRFEWPRDRREPTPQRASFSTPLRIPRVSKQALLSIYSGATARCEILQRQGLPDCWDGVIRLNKK